MSETNLYNTLKNCIGIYDRIDRIENIRVNGMPDTNICMDGVECWIELKYPTEPVRARTPLFGSGHKVSQEQKNWFLRQIKAGGRAYFLIGTKQRYLLLRGAMAEYINDMTIKELIDSALWHHTRPLFHEHWLELRSILTQ